MSDFNKYIFEEPDEAKKRTIQHISHFINTRSALPDKDGYYKRKGFLLGGWRYITIKGKRGIFPKIKDNENGTFSVKGLLFGIQTFMWQDIQEFI